MNQDAMQTKKCSKCQQIKIIIEFNKNRTNRDGRQYYCKNCQINSYNKWFSKNPLFNTPHSQRFRSQNPDYDGKWRRKNSKNIKRTNKKYNSKPETKEKVNNYVKLRYLTDLNFRILHKIRQRIKHALNNNLKSMHTIKLLGCIIQENNIFLEHQFYNNMTWNTQGNGYNHWQIHHICPLEFFNMSNPIEQQQAFHYSNTKPLWFVDHCEEHRKINERMSQYDPKDVYPWKY